MKRSFYVFASMVLMLFCANAAYPAAASPDYAFFKGRAIEIIVPHGPGGGFDTYARMIGPFLKKYIPGSNVVINNVTGAGGLRGRNQLWVSKPDGLTICLTSGSGMLFAQWSGIEGVQYDVSKISWIGRIASEIHVMAICGKLPYKSFEDMLKADKVFKFGYSGVGSDDYFASLIIAKFFGLKIDPITGYSGSREANLAAVKGEVDGIEVEASSLMPLFKSGDLRPVLAVGIKRDPEIPAVPTAFELAKNQESKDTAKALAYAFEIDRVLFAPPEVPAGRLEVLREAYQKTVNDPDFKKMLEKNRRPLKYLSGPALEELVADIFKTERLLRPQVEALRKMSK